MEWSLDGFATLSGSYYGAEGLNSLPFRSCGECEERLIVMSALTDDGIYILISQIYFIFFDTGFLGMAMPMSIRLRRSALALRPLCP